MSSYKEAKYRAKIKIEHFPSRNELLFLINNFLEESRLLKDYKSINQDNQILLIFKNSDSAFEVAKRLKIEQLKNSIYAKMEVAMSLVMDYDSPLKRQTMMRNKPDTLKKRLMTIDGHDTQNQRTVKKNFESGLLGSSPYLSVEEKARLENLQNKLKWISNKSFNPFVGNASMKKKTFIPNFVGSTPSDPPVNYKFREIHKEKWTSNATFK